MKAVFISFNQSYYEQVVAILDRNHCRGFTSWEQVQGRGSEGGEPHYGSHAWPTLNSAMLVVTEDSRVEKLLANLHALDQKTEAQGLRAFVWNIEQAI